MTHDDTARTFHFEAREFGRPHATGPVENIVAKRKLVNDRFQKNYS